MWRVDFRAVGEDTDKTVTLHCEEFVTTESMVFVTLRGIRTKHRSGVLSLPNPDYDRFAEFSEVTFPTHALVFAGRVRDETVVKPSPLVLT